MLQSWGFEGGQNLHPGFPDALLACNFGVQFRPVAGMTDTYNISADINPPTEIGLLVWGADARFLYKMPPQKW